MSYVVLSSDSTSTHVYFQCRCLFSFSSSSSFGPSFTSVLKSSLTAAYLQPLPSTFSISLYSYSLPPSIMSQDKQSSRKHLPILKWSYLDYPPQEMIKFRDARSKNTWCRNPWLCELVQPGCLPEGIRHSGKDAASPTLLRHQRSGLSVRLAIINLVSASAFAVLA